MYNDLYSLLWPISVFKARNIGVIRYSAHWHGKSCVPKSPLVPGKPRHLIIMYQFILPKHVLNLDISLVENAITRVHMLYNIFLLERFKKNFTIQNEQGKCQIKLYLFLFYCLSFLYWL